MTGSLDLSGFKLTFDDEFNVFSSNGPANPSVSSHTGTWDTTYAYGERKLNDEVEQYSDPTIGVDPDHVAGGVLSITAAPSADPAATWGQSYTSGVITTNHSFSQTYGYFEMRAELPEGVGMWPAFWLLPKAHVWPPELDPLEAFGSGGTTGEGGATSLHSGLVDSGGGQGAWHDTDGADLYTSYNTFGVDWEATTITFYLNGKAYASMATPAGFDQPMYMLANLAVGGGWAGAPIGETAALKIDYIRAFSADGDNPAVVQQQISSPDGRGYDFYGATDANGNGALGGTDATAPTGTAVSTVAAAPTGTQVIGAGPDSLVLDMSEDYYQGDAQFVVTIDGTAVGGVLSTSASHAAGATQQFVFQGDYGVGQHTLGVNFINNVGGATGADRNLFVDGATIDGRTITGSALSEYGGGLQSFTFSTLPGTGGGTTGAPTPVIVGTGPDDLVLLMSEDAWNGDAQFTVSVDGTGIGGTLTATATHAAGQEQAFTLLGSFGSGPHTVQVTFLNDAYGGSALQDRNVYIDTIQAAGAVSSPRTEIDQNGTAAFQTVAATPVIAAVAALFDATYYLKQNPDVAATGVDPLQHYLSIGWREGRNPSALFDTRYYLVHNPDVAAAGVDPLEHYATVGWMEGRDPSSAFSTQGYLAANPDVAGQDPLAEYMNGGQASGHAAVGVQPATTVADPLIDAAYITAQRPDVAAAGVNPVTWFLSEGWREGVNPNADFDTRFYLARNPDVAAAGLDPLLHYEQFGWKEGRDPSLLFSPAKYLAANPDLVASNQDPLLQYITAGQAAGRMAFLSGAAIAADPLVDAAYYDAQLGATLIPTGVAAAQQAAADYMNGGWKLGYSPDPLFDTSYYLSHNPDVAAAGIDPLLHFETYGWHEGRNPSAAFSTAAYLGHNPDVAAAGVDPLLHYLVNGASEGRAITAAS